MRGFVIMSKDTKRYVAYPGAPESYTRNILNARRYATRADAEADCCGNEVVLNLADRLA